MRYQIVFNHIKLRLSLFLLAFLINPVIANPIPPTLSMIPKPPAVSAKAYLLIDAKSDYIITEHNMHERIEPASLTKMMTVYAIDQALKGEKLKRTDMVHISEKAWRMEGSRTFLETNASVPAEDLIKGIIIQSGNDASVALAEHIAGTEETFAETMNFYAQQLGMKNTHFVNATGLPDPNHYSTAYDLALLSKALIRDFPETYSIYSQKWFTYQGIKQMNRNRLLWRNDNVDGIKTGHTDSAGYCLVASAIKDDTRLIAIVLGTPSDTARTEQAHTLLSYGLRFYKTYKFYLGNTGIQKSRLWMGKKKEILLGLTEDLYLTIGETQYSKLQPVMEVTPIIKAPVTKGTVLGTLKIKYEDNIIIEKPLVALESIKESNFLSRLWDYMTLSFHAMWKKIRS